MRTKKKPTSKRPFVIVRTYSAGVHAGELVKRDGKEVQLANARRIWRWYGANTLHEMSLAGLDTKQSRVSKPVASIVLTEVIEVIACTSEARAVIESAGWAS